MGHGVYIVTCSCGQAMRVAQAHVGKAGTCTRCGRVVEVTAGSIQPFDDPSDTEALRKIIGGSGDDGVPVEWHEGDVILDLYEVLGILGEGGMGKVYRVRHRGWGMDLAVKSPRPRVLLRTEGVAKFEAECATWIDLGLHPHTVSCYYVRRIGGIPRIFAEYVEGGTLWHWIRNRRLYEGGHEASLARIVDVAIQFAWGLQHAHARGFVHQDVKPSNLLLTPQGLAKVADFGLARALQPEGEEADPTGRTGMTRVYRSPEQAKQME